MAVNGPGPVSSSFPVKPTQSSTPTPQVEKSGGTRPISTSDEVEISSAARMMEQLNQSSDPTQVQAERLAQIKAAIERGEYETPEKLEIALSRMMAEIETNEGE